MVNATVSFGPMSPNMDLEDIFNIMSLNGEGHIYGFKLNFESLTKTNKIA